MGVGFLSAMVGFGRAGGGISGGERLMAELQALIFDVDGTLAETEEVHRAAFNRVFEEQGLGWHWDRPLYKRLLDVTGGKERLRYWLEGPFEAPSRDEFLVRDDLGEWIAAMHKRKTALYTEMIDARAVDLRPGVVALIAAARREHVRLAIATTTSLPNIESLLAATIGGGWRDVFPVIAAGDQVKAKKPAPDVFLLALERLGLPAEACIALEDSENGIRSAQAAGLGVLITTSVYTADQMFPGALAVVGGLDELAGSARGTADEGVGILDAMRDLQLRAA